MLTQLYVDFTYTFFLLAVGIGYDPGMVEALETPALGRCLTLRAQLTPTTRYLSGKLTNFRYVYIQLLLNIESLLLRQPQKYK